MSEQTIDRLQIEISASASKSVDGVDRLSHSLQALKAATQGSVGDLGEISMSLRILKETATEIRGTSGTITAISKSLGALKELRLGNLDELKNASSALGTIGDSMNSMREFRSGIGSLKTAFGNLEKFDFDGISIKITGLVEAIKPLTDEMIRGGQGVSNYGTQMKELASAMKMTNSLKGSVGSDSRGVAYTAHRSTSATWNFTKLKAGITVLKEVGTHIGDYVGEINNYIEDLNLFTVAMGDFADRGMSFANRMQDELGVNAGEAMRYMGVFKQMTSSMGFAEERAYTLSQNLTQLAYDMSSFYNLSVEESFTKLQSGLSGEAEPLRRLGIDISATRMQTELYNLGIKQSVEDLSQADKATLRYMTILKQANNALGDLSRSIDSPSNAMRTLNAQWEVAKREIGSVFIPALIKILPPAIAATRILGDLARELAGFLGFELPKIDYSGVGNLSVGLGSASDNADGLKDNLKDVKKEVSGLVGIDEINKLSETGGASGGLSGGSSGSIDVPSVLEGIDMPSYDMFSGIENGVDKWTEKFKGFFSTLKEEIRPFTPLLETMGTLFLSAFGFEWVRRSVTRFGGLEKLKAVISPITRGVGLFKGNWRRRKIL